jgi:hypothetical protein
MRGTKILYSINVHDVQDVAQQDFDRKLNDEQIKSVADKLGAYIDWYEAVNNAIAQTIGDGKKYN